MANEDIASVEKDEAKRFAKAEWIIAADASESPGGQKYTACGKSEVT